MTTNRADSTANSAPKAERRASSRVVRPTFRSASAHRGPATEMRGLISDLLARSNFADRHGLTFQLANGGYQRDLSKALGYLRTLKFSNYLRRYERGGIAERIVEAYPNATWASGIYIAESKDQTESPFEVEINDLFARLDLWEKLNRADILAGLGRYSVLLIGAPGKLETPLPKSLPAELIAFVTPFSEDTAQIGAVETSPTSPRFGLPLYYNITMRATDGDPNVLAANGTTVATIVRKVHYSRIIHISENCLESDIFGKPRLRAVWNYLDDLDKLVGGGSEAAWKRMDPGMQLNVNPEVEMTDEEEDDLNDEVDEYGHSLRRVIRTRGAEIKLLSSEVAMFATNVASVLRMISGTTGIPQRILLGTERGELASTQDRDNWADRVGERRRRFADPLIQSIVQRFIAYGVVPEPATRPFVTWPKMEEMTEGDKAKMLAQICAANASMAAAGAGIVLSPAEIRDMIYGLPDDPSLAEIEPPKAMGNTDPGFEKSDGGRGQS